MGTINAKVFFDYSFCIQKGNIRKIQFEVEYIQLGANQNPHFGTSACIMNHRRTDINEGGQAQESVLPKNSLAYKFYKKWEKKQWQMLTEEEMTEVLNDIEELKNKYDYVSMVGGKFGISFHSEVDLQRKNIRSLEGDKFIDGFDYKIHEK